MIRTLLTLAAGIGVGVAVTFAADHDHHKAVKVTQLSQRDIIEKLDGKDARATVKEVTFEPGQEDSPHRHTGPVFGYVLEGEYEHALDDEPVKKYKAGGTFYEPSGSFHRVARNPSGKTRTRLLAVVLHSRDTKETTVPEKGSVAPAAEGPRRAAFGETVTRLAERPVPNIPGKRLVVDAVDYVPGGYSASHRHAGSAFIYAYVVSGEIRSQVNDEPVRVYKAGEQWFENPGSHHRVSENASATKPARLIAVIILDATEKEVTIPEKGKE